MAKPHYLAIHTSKGLVVEIERQKDKYKDQPLVEALNALSVNYHVVPGIVLPGSTAEISLLLLAMGRATPAQ